MIQRRPFLVEVMTPKLGLAVGARYTYMIGVNNELALRHVPGTESACLLLCVPSNFFL